MYFFFNCIGATSALKKKSIYITKLKSQVTRAEHRYLWLHEHSRGLLAPLGHRGSLPELSARGPIDTQLSTLTRDQTSLLISDLPDPLCSLPSSALKSVSCRHGWQLYTVWLWAPAWPPCFHRLQSSLYAMLYDYNRGSEVFLLERVDTIFSNNFKGSFMENSIATNITHLHMCDTNHEGDSPATTQSYLFPHGKTMTSFEMGGCE